MKILAIESSATAASVAVTEDEFLLAQSFQNTGLTHSRTLMPMAEDLLKNCGLTLQEIEVIAVAAGPGSFTGLRIGIATAKGLAWTEHKPCAGCSTLEAMAWQLAHLQGELCPCMDARRNQVYNARFQAENGILKRLAPDRAISLEELTEEVKSSGKEQILIGDGANICYNHFRECGIQAHLAPPHLRLQSAWGVARAALEQIRDGKLVTGADLVPQYHRLSQAERERLEKEKN
jgi:tRNA threonylcarbamoyladenosine biosynthesis protein TsaB